MTKWSRTPRGNRFAITVTSILTFEQPPYAQSELQLAAEGQRRAAPSGYPHYSVSSLRARRLPAIGAERRTARVISGGQARRGKHTRERPWTTDKTRFERVARHGRLSIVERPALSAMVTEINAQPLIRSVRYECAC